MSENQEAKTCEDFQVVVLSGPSGSGKSTIVHMVTEQSPVPLMKAISATTRPQRPNEKHGDSYWFLTPEEFEHKRLAGEFLEYEEVFSIGFWYGTLRSELQRAKNRGAWALLEIDVKGALKVMEAYPDALTIFIHPPSDEELKNRLIGRKSETPEVIAKRLHTAEQEMRLADKYQYQVINDDLNRAVREICQILSQRKAEHHAGGI